MSLPLAARPRRRPIRRIVAGANGKVNWRSSAGSAAREKNPDVLPTLSLALAELSKDERDAHRQLVAELKSAKSLPRLPLARVVRRGDPRQGHVYLRGDFSQKGPAVDALFPRVLETVVQTADLTGNPRARLAAWLTRSDHPLVARVMANRLWQSHFGEGLVASTSDFGVMGQSPTDRSCSTGWRDDSCPMAGA